SNRRLLDALKAKPAGRGKWIARCPAHDDRTPSLSLRETDDARWLWRCHAGCSQEAVRDALRRLGLEDATANTDYSRHLKFTPPSSRSETSRRVPSDTASKARTIWREAVDPIGSP